MTDKTWLKMKLKNGQKILKNGQEDEEDDNLKNSKNKNRKKMERKTWIKNGNKQKNNFINKLEKI